MRTHILAAAAAFTMTSAAHAAPVTFFGEDLGGSIAGDPSTARASFLATLSGGVGTEDFEAPTALPSIDFAGSTGTITATLSGGGASIESSPGGGRFATSGSRLVETAGGGDFSISFSSAISAFGFYATDVGDFGNELFLRLTDTLGVTTDLSVGHTVGSIGSTDGAAFFFGFVDAATAYTNIEFLNQPGGIDVFGFDDMTVGDVNQVVIPPSAVPLPASALLLLAGLGGFGVMRRRR